ncbi:TPA: hypothetical protein ACPZN0_004558 [Yersinia enterocolitica]|uniref:hypothetical protein n=1 Tax=Yersinia enterocolitica TaxID=630 RepID=UPI002AC5206E|nr:hypothetical protein [Yersinia enterocolitica]HDL6648426.1 hypothetical protein [Yersinia enterocolitica]HDL7179860.1 hypothetical protein [Yersinia enterocolitica]HDL7449401.1 hypothetical protein [Yersinia enterocolitica]HEN3233966.1 hypothetical protein [Yersinia enterocolitica]
MSLDMTIKVESSGVEIDRYKHLTLELVRAELVEAVEIKDIVGEYGSTDLLEEIGKTDVISWIENQGYTVTETE